MSERTILIRDRKTGSIARIRHASEPVKLRLCRRCRKPHSRPALTCRAA